MTSRSTWIITGLVTSGVLLGGLIVFLVLPKPHVVHLPGGTELTLAAVKQGRTNIYVPGSPLQRLLYNVGLTNGVHIGNFKIQLPQPINDTWRTTGGQVARYNNVAIWLRHSGPANARALPINEQQWYTDIRATLADESGEEWEARPGIGRFHAISSTNLCGFSVWDFTAFPRRGKRLTFKLYARNRSDWNKWDTVAEFKTPNPARAHYPKWKPMTLPATQNSGDLEVSLMD